MILFAYLIKILKYMFNNIFHIHGNLLNFILLATGMLFIILGFNHSFFNELDRKVIIITLGAGMCSLGINNLINEQNIKKTTSDWRKKIFKLEQKSYYTIDDLYELNSYINPYSKTSETSIIINEVIVCILKNHNIKYKTTNSINKLKQKDNLLNQKKNLKKRKNLTTYIWIFLFSTLIEFISQINTIIKYFIKYFNFIYDYITHNYKIIIIYLCSISFVILLSLFIYKCTDKYYTKQLQNVDEAIENIDKNIDKDIDKDITNLQITKKELTFKKNMILFLETNNKKELKLEDNTNLTIFDFEINHKIVKVPKLDTKLDQNYGYLTPKENNLVRLCCHILLKAEWEE